jgi:hypothetical protein
MNNAQNTRLASLCTPILLKQNLSASSISPAQNNKKNKVYVSPNRLAPLATDDNNDVATTMSLTILKDFF